MRSPLPRLFGPKGRRAAVLAALMLIVAAHAARAFDVAVPSPRQEVGYVWADVYLSDLFDRRVEESLGRGMPATLQLRVELWRHRTVWFDAMERSFEGSIRIRYEVVRKSFRVERAGTEVAVYDVLDSVRTALAGPISIPVTRIENLKNGPRYYVVVTATLKPLSVEDVEEVEGWLSGEVESGRGSGLGIVTAIPRAMFDAARNFAGFGDQRARATSPDFERSPARR